MKMMKAILLLLAAGGLIAVLMMGGEDRNKQRNPIPLHDTERVLIVCMDPTGSMEECLEPAWEMFERALAEEARVAGSTSMLIVADLSRADPVVLIATPMEFRQKYPDFESFRKWLTKGPQVGSRIYDGIADAIDAGRALPGNPVQTLLVFSDMDSNVGGGKERLLKSLAEFGRRKEPAAVFSYVQKDAGFWAEELKTRVKYSAVYTTRQTPRLPARD